VKFALFGYRAAAFCEYERTVDARLPTQNDQHSASLRLGMAGNATRKRRKRLDGTSGKFCGYRAARSCDHCHVQRTRSTYRTINTFADVCSLRRSCANPGDARPASKVPGCVCRRHHIMMMSSLQLRTTTTSSSSISLQRSAASRSARHATDYTQGEVTSQSLWSPYDHHFVGIIRHHALSYKANIYRVIQIKLNQLV